MGEAERRISARPLFAKLDKEKGAAAALAEKLNISHGRLANWRKRGVPAAMLPHVAAYLGLSTDDYLRAAGWPRIGTILEPRGQYTIEGQKFLDDFYALPDGLQEHIAKKTAELRAYADALPPFIRAGLKPPTDPEAYRAWEKDMELDMGRRLSQPPPAQVGKKAKRSGA